MKLLIVLLLMAAIYTGCESDSGSPVNRDVLVPLTIGNTWTYKNVFYDSLGNTRDSSFYTLRVLADTMIEGERWGVMGTTPDNGALFINRSDGFYQGYMFAFMISRLMYRYPTSVGQTLVYRDQSAGSTTVDSTYVTSLDHSVTTSAGTFSCHHYTNHSNDDRIPANHSHHENFIAPNIGFVKAVSYLDLSGGGEYVMKVTTLENYSVQ